MAALFERYSSNRSYHPMQVGNCFGRGARYFGLKEKKTVQNGIKYLILGKSQKL